MALMNQLDAISAKEGTVFFTEGTETKELAELISIEAEIEYKTAVVATLGSRMEGEKVVGAKGTGKMKLYYHRPEMKRRALQYIKEGVVPRLDIKTSIEDKTSRAGRYTVLLKNVLLKKMLLTKLDASSDDVLEEEIEFSFQDMDILENFKEIQY